MTRILAALIVLLLSTAVHAQSALYPPNTVLAGPTTGSPAFPTPRVLVPADIAGLGLVSASNNILTNAGFALDQQNAGTATTLGAAIVRVVDRWFAKWVVSTSGAGNPTVQRVPVSAGFTVTPDELKISATTAGGTVPAALDFIVFQSVEGSDVADLQQGTANATGFVVTVNLKSSLSSAVVPVFVQNAAANRSFVHNCPVASAATWTVCTFIVAGDITGTWNRAPDSVGMVVGLSAACGATFQTTADAWQAGNFNCTAAQTQYTNNAAATLETAAAVVNRGTFAVAYFPIPAATLISMAERYYRKSFALATAPVTNAGTNTGEACYENPIAAGEAGLTVYYSRMFGTTQTITTFNPAAANANFRNETAAADVAVGTVAANPTNAYIPTAATVATIAQKVCIHYTVDAGL
jgi:hypothetical protein